MHILCTKVFVLAVFEYDVIRGESGFDLADAAARLASSIRCQVGLDCPDSEVGD